LIAAGARTLLPKVAVFFAVSKFLVYVLIKFFVSVTDRFEISEI
jgi:hypothetical protein